MLIESGLLKGPLNSTYVQTGNEGPEVTKPYNDT